ncbi:phosphatidate cytidylyltransferase [Duncaniella muris]|jgi:phosphatidate cytidylyltransferase|uniref:phosphatidate cytidylyltransferase n=1 Tax=Duncaniella muris TaxID=2094150 RepID=UPI0025B77C98|nr:phosphatidate cytidylyltransferase [Duncaniella muris]
MKNLIVRSMSGAVYAALIVCAIMFGGAWAFPALCTVFAILGTGELTRLCYGTRTPALTALDMAGAAIVVSAPAACLVCASGGIYTASLAATGAFFVYFLARLICQLYLPGENAVGSISAAFTSLMYVAMPLCCASMMYLMYGPSIILTMFIMIWLNDTGAFCVGSLIGKRRLFERISPKKSWEGFAGGLVFSIAGGALIYFLFGKWAPGLGLAEMCTLGAVVSVFATWGDLVESLLKRTAGVKDSGHIMPGHGGILDRIDSLLLVAPALACYMAALTLI